MLAELRRCARRRRAPRRSAAPPIRSSRTRNTFGALTLAASWRATSSCERHRRGRLRRTRSPRWRASTRRVAARAEGAARCMSCACAPGAAARRRRQQGQPPAADAQPRAAGPQRRAARANGRVALEMLRRRRPSTCCCSTSRCRRWTASRCSSSSLADRAAARPAGDRDLVARGPRQHRALHRARRRGLPAPSRSTPVLLKARIGASLEKKRLRDQQKELVRRFATSEVAQDLQQSGFALGGRRVRGSVMFCRHPRLHRAGRVAAAGRDDRAAQHLLHADVRRDQRPRRRRQPDDRRRPDGDLRRAAAARRPRRRRRCAPRSR